MGVTRVLALGFDAAERSIVLDLAARGRMPAVRSLLERGHHTTLEAPPHVFVGAVWPSLYTGAPAAVHGRWAPQALRAGSYETEWRGPRTAIEPFWGSLARAGRRIAAIDVPLAPLTQVPNVVQLAEWETHDNAGPVTSWVGGGPDEFAELADVPMDSCDVYHRSGRLADLRRHLVARIERKTELLERLMRRSDWDLLFAVYGASHCVGHQCWHLHDPAHPLHDAAAEALGDPIIDVYEALDTALGRLCEGVDQDTTVALVLSHGMGPHHDGTHLLGELLRRIEDATLGPPPLTTRAREAAYRRAGRLRRVAQDAERRVDGDLGRVLDGSRRFLRAPNATPVGCVRLNVVGREPRGRVEVGSEYDSVSDLLIRELSALVDPADGQPLVRRVQRTSDVHSGPFAEQMGDVFVEWRRDRPITAAASPVVGVVRGQYTGIRTGDHHPGGLLVAAGPGVDGNAFATGLDGAQFAPMVSSWLGVDSPAQDAPSESG